MATIVPTEFIKDQSYLTPFARNLINEGVIEAVRPEEYAYSRADDYMNFLDWAEKNSNKFRLDSTYTKTNAQIQFNIHIRKLGYIGSELEKMGIAESTDKHWYRVNQQFCY